MTSKHHYFQLYIVNKRYVIFFMLFIIPLNIVACIKDNFMGEHIKFRTCMQENDEDNETSIRPTSHSFNIFIASTGLRHEIKDFVKVETDLMKYQQV